MIDGKAVMKFGDGSVLVTPLCNNLETEPLGAVCFNNDEPGAINRKTPILDQKFSEEAAVIMTFTRVESIDVVIEALTWVKKTMNNETPETDKIGWDKPFNLNIIKEKEEMKKDLLPEIKRYAKTILAAPNAKRVDISTHTTKADAEAKSARMKTWPYKVIVRARDEKGRFTKEFALICCK